MKHFGRKSSAKGNHPTPGQLYFPARKEIELVDAMKCWARSILF